MARPPSTPYEERIDYSQIKLEEEARAEELLKVLRKLLARIQQQTLRWVYDELYRKKQRTAIRRFKLPLAPSYSAQMRTHMTKSAAAGKRDAYLELGLKQTPLNPRERSRARETADATTAKHISRLEGDLKTAWAAAMNGVVDKDQLRYVTEKVFADFAGWVQPEPPN